MHLLVIAFLIALGCPSAMASDVLDQFRWSNRLLIINAPGVYPPKDAAAADQLALINDAGYADRDMVVLYATAADLTAISFSAAGRAVTTLPGGAASVRDAFRIPADGFSVVLVGKDGTAKYSSNEPIPNEDLFSIIDAMPMRQREMRRSATGSTVTG